MLLCPCVYGLEQYKVKLQWLEHLGDHKNMFETRVVELISVNQSARSGGIIGTSFRFSLTSRYVVSSH